MFAYESCNVFGLVLCFDLLARHVQVKGECNFEVCSFVFRVVGAVCESESLSCFR